MRWPFPQYHSDKDNMEITSQSRIEEVIEMGIRLIDILELDCTIRGRYKGLVCLSNRGRHVYKPEHGKQCSTSL